MTWSLPTETPSLFLTFDDGPIPQVTNEVLSILDKYQAKASFFCVGENVKNNPSIYKELIDKGHAVGNHTFNHLNGWKTNNKEYYRNILKASEYIKSPLFRPPYGKITLSQSKLIHTRYKIIMWDVLSGDFDPKLTWQGCVKNVTKHAQDGSIIVFHDSLKASDTMIKALPTILEYYAN